MPLRGTGAGLARPAYSRRGFLWRFRGDAAHSWNATRSYEIVSRTAQGPILVEEALPIAKQIAEALEAAHEQGIIQRDLKPANIKVKPHGTVKVFDFGVAMDEACRANRSGTRRGACKLDPVRTVHRVEPVSGRRLLICGPTLAGGGLHIALTDLARGLEHRGWRVDLAFASSDLVSPLARRDQNPVPWTGRRWRFVPRLGFLPDDVRTVLQHMAGDGGFDALQSDVMHALERRLDEQRYDAVLAYVARETPGFARFIVAAHPRVILLSLNGLGVELRLARWLPLARVCARLLSTEPLHPCVYTPVAAGVVRLAVFASDGWRNEAVEAGLPSGAARTVYFGVPLGRRLPDEHPFEYRLLWVGRLSREKGLHHFIDAVAQLRRTQPATLTAVCGPGPAEYERAVRRQIERRGLGNAVRLMPPVERDALPAVYAAHDALLFDSPFAEPVALVVMEAFAAGLPVLTRRPAAAGPLLGPDETCLCFETSSPRAIAAAVCRAAEDQVLRRAVRRRAYALVRQRFSVEDTTAAYDDILYDLLRTANG